MINRKQINNEKSDESDTEERYKIQISDEATMISGDKINDDDYQVNKDSDQGKSKEEPEEKDQTEISKNIYALESNILEHSEKYEKDKEDLLIKTKKTTEGDEYDLFHTYNDREERTKYN